MRFCCCIVFGALLLFCGGGCWYADRVKDEPGGGTVLLYDHDYVSAAGKGFHWLVDSELPEEDHLWCLQVIVNGTVVCGSDFGLPSDIFIGFWDKKSAEFYFADQTIPADAVPVKITFVFHDGRKGQAVGFLYAEEGENIFVSGDMLLNADSPLAALVEFNADSRRIRGNDVPVPESENIFIRTGNLDYLPANSILLHLSRALKPGQIPVAEIETTGM